MGPIFRGKQGVVLVSDEPSFDAENGVLYRDQTFAGSKAAIYGLFNDLKANNISSRTSNSGPIYSLTCRIPSNDPVNVADLDRYEIQTESFEKSIFEFPEAIAEAEDYDALLTDGMRTYREWAEESARRKITDSAAAPVGSWPIQETIIRHLKNGVTGFQNDLIVLRRLRKVDQTYGYGDGKMNLSDGQIIYTTEQLNLPPGVAFVVPDAPATADSAFDDYSWGWKLRNQRVEIVGIEAEQTVELLFAPWSNFFYERSTGNLNW